MIELHDQITLLLTGASDYPAALKNVLRLILAHFKSETGTIHRLDPEKKFLHLAAEAGLPAAMIEIVKAVPVGKGIAGQTVERNGPVSICNLQTDTSGVARPGARQTGVGGALCVPLRAGETIVGTLGIGTMRPYEYTANETHELEELGRLIGSRLGR